MTLRALSKQETLKRDLEIIKMLTHRDIKKRKSAKEVAQLFNLEDKTIYNILYKRRSAAGKTRR